MAELGREEPAAAAAWGCGWGGGTAAITALSLFSAPQTKEASLGPALPVEKCVPSALWVFSESAPP